MADRSTESTFRGVYNLTYEIGAVLTDEFKAVIAEATELVKSLRTAIDEAKAAQSIVINISGVVGDAESTGARLVQAIEAGIKSGTKVIW